MAFKNLGPCKYAGGMDDEGNREYYVTFKLQTNTTPIVDGVQQAMVSPTLPAIGSIYQPFGNEIDVFAWRRPGCVVEVPSEYREGDLPRIFLVTVTYSTKRRDKNQERPNPNQDVQNPLSEPPRIDVNFTDFTVKGSFDRFGKPIQFSSFEQIDGPANQWDSCRISVTVSQNVLSINAKTLLSYVNCVNSKPMWGFAKRCIKMARPQYQKVFGRNGSFYFARTLNYEIWTIKDVVTRYIPLDLYAVSGDTITLTLPARVQSADVGREVQELAPDGTLTDLGVEVFSVDEETNTLTLNGAVSTPGLESALLLKPIPGTVVSGWDRDIADRSAYVIRGAWNNANPPAYVPDVGIDRNNPKNYVRAQDSLGGYCELLLDGNGAPYNENASAGAPAGNVHVEFYEEKDLFQLGGVPTSIDT